MAMSDDDSTLGCGRTVADVWERIDLPPDEHETTCPDCTDARRSLGRLAVASTDLRRQDRDDATLDPPADLLGQIMDVARAEVRRGRTLPLREPEPLSEPTLTVSEQTVASLVRQIADRESAVEARRCAVVTLAGRTQVGAPAAMAVELRLSVASGTAIPETTARLRRAIIAEVGESVGVEVPTVELIVEDVHDV